MRLKDKLPKWNIGRFLNLSNFKSLSMVGNVNMVERDKADNYWYLNGLYDFVGSNGKSAKVDMSTIQGKMSALNACTPFSTTVDKCGSLFSNGRFYVVDQDNNEHNSPKDKNGKFDALYPKYQKIRSLLSKPNPLQSGRQFNKQVEICLKTFGFCPIFTFRAIPGELPISMWVIPPALFHAELSGKLWYQSELSEIISKAYISWGGVDIVLEEGDYFIISDGQANISPNKDELKYSTVVDSLSDPVNNWIAQMSARGTLIIDGGPKGIICDNSGGDIYGNSSLSPKEQDELNEKFKRKYGIVNKLYSILVTRAKLSWVPISSQTSDLMLHEEDTACRNLISNAIGLNPNVFVYDSKYANQDSAKISAYQDLIIPDSENYSEALTRAIVGEGVIIKLDYTHISCLQEDKQNSARAFSLATSAISRLYNDGLITDIESRKEIANLIDINPDKPEGQYKSTTSKEEEVIINEE